MPTGVLQAVGMNPERSLWESIDLNHQMNLSQTTTVPILIPTVVRNGQLLVTHTHTHTHTDMHTQKHTREQLLRWSTAWTVVYNIRI